MTGERKDHILQTTALVHEAYLKIGDDIARAFPSENAESRFYFAAARAMRQILIEEARRLDTLKRGAANQRIDLNIAVLSMDSPSNYLAVHEALSRLEDQDSRAAQVVELRFYGGVTMDRIAALLGVSKRTAEDDWAFARAWLRRALRDEQ